MATHNALSLAVAAFACALVGLTYAQTSDAFTASLKRAMVEAHCPEVRKGTAVRAITCISKAGREVFAELAPGSLDLFEAYAAGNLKLAQNFDEGQISAQQYTSEIRARTDEFFKKGRQAYERPSDKQQCENVTKAFANPWACIPRLH